MDQQRELFDDPNGLVKEKPVARVSDPPQSHAAISRFELKGARRESYERLLDNGKWATANEVGEMCGGYRSETIRKRVPELVETGLVEVGEVRTCSVTGKQAQTFRAKPSVKGE